MAHTEARVWWADVQHLRDDYDRTDEARRRADEADLAERRGSSERHRADVYAGEPAPPRRTRLADEAVAQAHRARVEDVLPAPRRPHFDDVAPAARRSPHQKGSALPARRTIEIRGRTVPAPAVPRSTEIERRRPPRRAIASVGSHPDRIAMWALLMGILLILVAIGTGGH